MNLQSIKLDKSFPEHGTRKLEELLNEGWIIFDKEVGERYTVYIMCEDPELEDTSPDKEDNRIEEVKAWKPEEEIMKIVDTHFAPRRSGATNDCKDAIKELLASSRKV